MDPLGRKGLLGLTLLLSLLALPVLTRAALDEGLLRGVWRAKEGLPLLERREQRLQAKLYDCGPAALAEALRQRGIAVRSEELEPLAGTTVLGTTMLGLQRAATALGVRTEGMILTWESSRRASLEHGRPRRSGRRWNAWSVRSAAPPRPSNGYTWIEREVMTVPQPRCPTCHEAMEEGFMVDFTYGKGAARAANWIEGTPKKSFWSGVELKGREMRAIVAFRCPRCGFLQNFAP